MYGPRNTLLFLLGMQAGCPKTDHDEPSSGNDTEVGNPQEHETPPSKAGKSSKEKQFDTKNRSLIINQFDISQECDKRQGITLPTGLPNTEYPFESKSAMYEPTLGTKEREKQQRFIFTRLPNTEYPVYQIQEQNRYTNCIPREQHFNEFGVNYTEKSSQTPMSIASIGCRRGVDLLPELNSVTLPTCLVCSV